MFASDQFKADKDLVTIAVKKTGTALEYAANDLKSNKDVVLAAVN